MEGKLSDKAVAALASSLLTSTPVVEGQIKSDSTKQRVYVGGRITGYQISHLRWERGKLVGLKTDRPIVDDELPPGWEQAVAIVQPVLAKD